MYIISPYFSEALSRPSIDELFLGVVASHLRSSSRILWMKQTKQFVVHYNMEHSILLAVFVPGRSAVKFRSTLYLVCVPTYLLPVDYEHDSLRYAAWFRYGCFVVCK